MNLASVWHSLWFRVLTCFEKSLYLMLGPQVTSDQPWVVSCAKVSLICDMPVTMSLSRTRVLRLNFLLGPRSSQCGHSSKEIGT